MLFTRLMNFFALGAAQAPFSVSDIDQLQSLASSALDTAYGLLHNNPAGSTCNHTNVQIRKEWSSLTVGQRKNYISAVKCLLSKPTRTPSTVSSGARTRFDDFIVTHIIQTRTIHYTANFLAWHRYFVWLYEQALREECGYEGFSPYWDWGQTAQDDVEKSALFDGSDTSLSGNGEHIPNKGILALSVPRITFPSGSGGGCVTNGPFANMTVNLGPAGLRAPGNITIGNGDGLSYNPRCWVRDLNNYAIQTFANATAIRNTIVQPQNVYDFQLLLQGVPGSDRTGVHGGGHFGIGGDPANDVWVSPGDPAFYLHHGGIDRTWWLWQMRDPGARVYSNASVGGTRTFLNDPPSPNATLDDYVDYGYAAGPPRQLRELMSTTGGPFCYVYQ